MTRDETEKAKAEFEAIEARLAEIQELVYALECTATMTNEDREMLAEREALCERRRTILVNAMGEQAVRRLELKRAWVL